LDHGAKGVDYEPDKEAVNRLDTAPDCAVFVASCTPSKPEDLPLYANRRTQRTEEPMSEQPSLPTEDDLKKLPLLAIVAYAVRCARRARPMLDTIPNFAAHGTAVEQAISLAERFCAGKELNDAPDAAERAADAAGRAAAVAHSFAGGSAVALAAGAAQAAVQAAAAVEDFWVQPDAADRVVRAATYAAGRASRAVAADHGAVVSAAARGDYDRLFSLNLGTYPDLGQPIDPTENGPLGAIWPE
jgi:hypothetical protein